MGLLVEASAAPSASTCVIDKPAASMAEASVLKPFTSAVICACVALKVTPVV